jgi:hypothetical protein
VQIGLSVAGLLLVVWFHPHYAGPLFISVFLLAVQGMRHLCAWRIRGRPIGASMVQLIVLFSILTLPINLLSYQFPGFANFWMVPEEWLAPRYFLLLLVAVCLLVLLRIRGHARPQPTEKGRPTTAIVEFGLLLVVMWQVCLATRNYKPGDVASPSFLRSAIEQQLDKLPGEHLCTTKLTSIMQERFGPETFPERIWIPSFSILQTGMSGFLSQTKSLCNFIPTSRRIRCL